MNSLVPTDAEAECTSTVDGYTYTVKVIHHGSGYRALLSWQRDGLARPPAQTTPVFASPRAAMIEGHSLAEELILAWRS